MKAYSDRIQVDLDYSDLSDIVGSLITRIEKLIEIRGPAILIKNSIDRAERLNEVLKKEDFDHWTNEKFEELRNQVK